MSEGLDDAVSAYTRYRTERLVPMSDKSTKILKVMNETMLDYNNFSKPWWPANP